MPTFDRYLLREFSQAIFATLVVLLMVSLGGVFADVLGDIASGRVPATMLLSQLGLQLIRYLPLVLPLALMLGMMLAVGRLYRDAEMPVLTSIGIGPRRMLRPLLLVSLPVIALVALCSLWWGPWAKHTSQAMISAANHNLLIAGLQPGRFTELPGGGGVVYVGSMSNDGTRLSHIFVYKQDGDRLDVTTAKGGALSFDGPNERYLTLEDGFRVEGPLERGLDYRLMRYASNDLRLPVDKNKRDGDDPEAMSVPQLLRDPRLVAKAQLHYRVVPPLLALAFALLAIPLARSPPRQARYGRMLMGFLAYMIGMDLMLLGEDWLGRDKIPMALGMWWLTLPLLGFALWLYLRDGHMRRAHRPRALGATR